MARARQTHRVSQFQNIRRFDQTASTIKGSAFRSRPENNRVGAPSATPGKRLVQQLFSKSIAPHFRNNIKVSYVCMNLGLVLNWIREFLKQMHTNIPKQLFAVVENPAAPWTPAGKESFFHPGCASSNKLRFDFRCRSGFSAKLVTQFS